MKKTVKEVAKMCGVSVRTLHYYHEIALLIPSETTASGYRLYDEANLKRLQQILFFRELDFPLKEIKKIFENKNYNEKDALKKQREMLRLKKNRLERLMGLIDQSLKGENMSFKEFDMSEIENAKKKYGKEAKELYGKTEAYKQSEKKTAGYRKEDWEKISLEAAAIYRGFADNMERDVRDSKVQGLVKAWQDHISKYFYDCSVEILAGLGQLYVADKRFTENIDQYQKGLADFMSRAIAVYCKDKIKSTNETDCLHNP